MATTFEGPGRREAPLEKVRTAEVVGEGSIAEGVAGAAAVVLAILGLAGALPIYMASIATITIGAALLFEGGSIAARYSSLIHEASAGSFEKSELGSGITAETLAGVAGVTLGILSLLGLAPMTLLPIAVIIFGGGLLIGSGATARLNDIVLEWRTLSDTTRLLAKESVSAAAGAQVLVGVGAIVLGILAVIGIGTMSLALVALLAVGVSVLMSGSAVGGKMLRLLHH